MDIKKKKLMAKEFCDELFWQFSWIKHPKHAKKSSKPTAKN